MKLRDRVVVGFALSLVLVTVLFVVDLQTENARRLAAQEDGYGDASGPHYHGRSDRSRDAFDAQSAWKAAAAFVSSTLVPVLQPPWPARPAAPQPYLHAGYDQWPMPAVPDMYAGDRFDDLAERLSRSAETRRHRDNVTDWTVVRDVIINDIDDDGGTSNEYAVEYLEDGMR